MDGLNSIVIYAFRYALGRSTYAVTDVCRFIKTNVSILNKNELQLIIKEIAEHSDYGMEIDKQEWLILKAFLEKEKQECIM